MLERRDRPHIAIIEKKRQRNKCFGRDVSSLGVDFYAVRLKLTREMREEKKHAFYVPVPESQKER